MVVQTRKRIRVKRTSGKGHHIGMHAALLMQHCNMVIGGGAAKKALKSADGGRRKMNLLQQRMVCRKTVKGLHNYGRQLTMIADKYGTSSTRHWKQQHGL
jgi:hypothetical protein